MMSTLIANQAFLIFQGQDAGIFLQGQLSCDCNVLDGATTVGLYCNIQGRIVSQFFLKKINSHHFIMSLDASLCLKTKEILQKYALFSKISIDDSDQAYQLRILDITQNLPESLIIANIEKIENQKSQEGQTTEGVESDDAVWRIACIQQKLPWLHVAHSEKYLPAELALDQLPWVSFKKGCYLGQEVIARMKYKGKGKMKRAFVYYVDNTLHATVINQQGKHQLVLEKMPSQNTDSK